MSSFGLSEENMEVSPIYWAVSLIHYYYYCRWLDDCRSHL
jgi:hypothetical protein